MLKKPITYTDFDGNTRTEDFYFNLSESELIDWQLTTEGGLLTRLQTIVKANEKHTIMKTFKEIILKAYGEKSSDGRYFDKSDEISTRFSHSAAFNVLYQELLGNDNAASEFINALLPADLAEKLAKQDAAKILTPGV